MALADRELLAKTLQAEAGNQGLGGMLAVGSVIRNRMAQGGSLSDVILAPAQFSAWNKVTGAVGGEQGQDMAAIKPSEDAYAAADAILSGNAPDLTGGATHYYNPSISNPAWGKEKAGGDWTKIGAHIFGKAGDFRTGAAKMNGEQAQKPQGLLGGLLGGQGIGGALGLSDDFLDKLKMGLLLGSDPRAFAPMVAAIQARGQERRTQKKAQSSANVTADYLDSINQKDIANLVRQQAIGGAEGLRLGTAGSGTDTTDYKNYLEFIKGMEAPISFREFYENYRTKKTPNIQSKGVYRAKDGTIIGEVNFDSSTGEYFQFDENGQRAVLDMRSLTPVTDATFANTIPSYNEFSKMQQELQTDIGSMKALQRYMTAINNTNEGFLRIADDLSANAKTLLSGVFGEEYTELTPEELNLRIGRGLQQGLIGRFRLETVGGGVMTEQDALRIIQNLGGDVNALQNKEVVAKQIKNLFMDKQRSYDRNKKRYDIALNQVYRSQGFEDLEDYKPDASVFDLKGKATDKTLDQLVAGMAGLSKADLSKYFQSLTDQEFLLLSEHLGGQ